MDVSILRLDYELCYTSTGYKIQNEYFEIKFHITKKQTEFTNHTCFAGDLISYCAMLYVLGLLHESEHSDFF